MIVDPQSQINFGKTLLFVYCKSAEEQRQGEIAIARYFEKFQSDYKIPPGGIDNRFVADALEQSKREGLRLTIHARLLILAVFGLGN